jgi:hypothetical protein
MTKAEFRGRRYRIEIAVTNLEDGGSLQVSCQRRNAIRERLSALLRRASFTVPYGGHAMVGRPTPSRYQMVGPWTKLALWGQAALTAAVFVLVLVERPSAPNFNTVQINQHRIAHVEEAVTVLTQTQSSQASMAKTLRALASEQRKLRAQLNQNAKEAEQRLGAVLRLAATERDELRSQIHKLSAENEGLAAAVLKLEPRETGKPKPSALRDPEKLESPKIGEVSLAAPGPGAQVADAKLAAPFTFWVAFNDGTSDQSIDDLIRDIGGRRGPVKAGWYGVEVELKKPQTPDQFFQSIQTRTKIVKALTTSLKLEPDSR